MAQITYDASIQLHKMLPSRMRMIILFLGKNNVCNTRNFISNYPIRLELVTGNKKNKVLLNLTMLAMNLSKEGKSGILSPC